MSCGYCSQLTYTTHCYWSQLLLPNIASKWAGHPGIKGTLALVKGTYYWSGVEYNVETFVRTCLNCQQDKIEKKKPGGLLEPLPTPKGSWESFTLSHARRSRREWEYYRGARSTLKVWNFHCRTTRYYRGQYGKK